MTDAAQLDAAILGAMDPDEWATADALTSKVGRSRTVDSQVVGGRLTSLRHRHLVESRVAGPHSEWRRSTDDVDDQAQAHTDRQQCPICGAWLKDAPSKCQKCGTEFG